MKLQTLLANTAFPILAAAGIFLGPVPHLLPAQAQTDFIPTLNQHGWMMTHHSALSAEFVRYAEMLQEGVVLDIGTAYGFVPLDLLNRTNHLQVIATDQDGRHLEILAASTPPSQKSRLSLVLGRFPNQPELREESVDAILVHRVLHFLTGNELELGMRNLYRFLKPGGKVFALAHSPYRHQGQSFVPHYEERKAKERYPGFSSNYNPTLVAGFLHFLDLQILERLFLDAQFEIELATYISLSSYKEREIRFSHQEHVAIIAVKPRKQEIPCGLQNR